MVESVQIETLAQSVEEFVTLRNEVAHTPYGGAVMMVVALLAYAQDRELGQQCLTVAVDRERLQKGVKGYKGWQLRNADLQRIRLQISGKEYLPRSYFQGATPENGYQLPSPPFVFEISENPYSGDVASGKYKVFVTSSGAPSPRPVTVQRNDKGVWKAFEWSSLIMGVQAPHEQIEDDL